MDNRNDFPIFTDQKELAELHRLACIGRCTERERTEEAEAKARQVEAQKQYDTERRIAQQVVTTLRSDSAANAEVTAEKQAEGDARVAEAVFQRLKAEEKRRAEKGKQNLGKALATALVGAVIGFYGSIIKTVVEDDE